MRYSAETTVTPPAVLRKARSVFGADGAGLRLSDLTLSSARFTGTAGFVAVEASRQPHGPTSVIIETQEFDLEARRFLLELPRQSWLVALWRQLRSKHTPSTRP